MNNKLNPIAGKEVKFNYNEPDKEIKDGFERESVIVSRDKYKQIILREQLNNILINHCGDEEITRFLKPEHEKILHTICLETVTSGSHPMIRKKAIGALKNYFTTESVNLLTDLAINGEDEYIRSAALNSIVAYNSTISIPLLIAALKDTSEIVSSTAKNGIMNIAKIKEARNILLTSMKLTKSCRTRKVLKEIIFGKIKIKKPISKTQNAKPD